MAIENGEIVDTDNGEHTDEDKAEVVAPSCGDLIKLCKQLEASCMYYGGDPQFSLNLSCNLVKAEVVTLQELPPIQVRGQLLR
jgi:hypothetical protein